MYVRLFKYSTNNTYKEILSLNLLRKTIEYMKKE